MPTGLRTAVETGDKYGYLTIIREIEKIGKARVVLCQCDCGSEKAFRLNQIVKGRVKSCGCRTREMIRQSRTTHGMPNKRLYNIWSNMRQRCSNPNSDDYPAYGGRSIAVCPEWLSFEEFYRWGISTGYAPNLSLDRIDNGGNYCPDNCRWATPTEQARNSRRNRAFTFQGEKKLLIEWAEVTGIECSRIRARIDRLGWSIEKTLTTPIKSLGNTNKYMEEEI